MTTERIGEVQILGSGAALLRAALCRTIAALRKQEDRSQVLAGRREHYMAYAERYCHDPQPAKPARIESEIVRIQEDIDRLAAESELLERLVRVAESLAPAKANGAPQTGTATPAS